MNMLIESRIESLGTGVGGVCKFQETCGRGELCSEEYPDVWGERDRERLGTRAPPRCRGGDMDGTGL